MDTQNLFKLNQALEAWRAALPTMSPDDRAELEGHLVDSMTELRNAGLSEAEAFWLARRRLGEAGDIGGLPGSVGSMGEPADRSSGRRCGWLLAGGLLCLVSLVAGIYPRMVPPRYDSHVVMELHRSPLIAGRDWVPQSRPESGKQELPEIFLATQMIIVQTKETRSHMIENMALPARWNLSAEECDQKLAGMIRVEALPGGEMIRLTVRSKDPAEAVDLANGLTDAYISRRKEEETDRISLLFQTLSHVRKGQEMEADRAEKQWREAAQAIGVTLTAPESSENGAQGTPLPANAGPALAAEYRQRESQVQRAKNTLRKVEEDMENARMAALHPLKPVSVHERPTQAAIASWPNFRVWNALAGVSGLLGAASVALGLRR